VNECERPDGFPGKIVGARHKRTSSRIYNGMSGDDARVWDC
jgi:hypothetical protein